MLSCKRLGSFYLVLVLMFGGAGTVSAEGLFREALTDSLYGSLAGGLLGAAMLAFTKKPGNHLENIGYAAAGGATVGMLYGLINGSGSLVEVDKGKVSLDIPVVIPDFQDRTVKGQPVVVTAELLHGTF